MTTTPSEIKSSKIASIIVWKVAGLLVKPKNMTTLDIIKTLADVKCPVLHTHPQALLSTKLTELGKLGTKW